MQIGILGARGYLGRELIRLLDGQHQILPASSDPAWIGRPIAAAVPGLRGSPWHFVSEETALAADAVLFATPSGVAAEKAPQVLQDDGVVVDLSRDHRAKALAGDGWVYGQPGFWNVEPGAKAIANPGCYPTAAALAIAPALQAGLVSDGPIIIDGKSGVSGAGVQPRADLHFPEMNESVRAYHVLGHDHEAEIASVASRLAGAPRAVRFTPHLVPQTRGLLVTAYLPTVATAEEVQSLYSSRYADDLWVEHAPEADTASVRGSHAAQVAVDVDEATGLIVARCAIDNLVRGGAGTAVENLNAALGLPRKQGLSQVAI